MKTVQRLAEAYRIPEDFIRFNCGAPKSDQEGFFAFGDTICFGACSSGGVSSVASENLHDASSGVCFENRALRLPFDPDQVVENLLLERYPVHPANPTIEGLLRSAYYALRPVLPVGIRKHIQRIYLSGWDKIPFPNWPVDCTADRILEKVLVLLMKAQGLSTVPFIWFWPKGYDACAIVTHDVEALDGMKYCSTLMDLDDSWGIKSSFQLVPQDRYRIPVAFRDEMRGRGFEVNVHDLNHEGNLFSCEHKFQEKVVEINRYGQLFQAAGFRAGVMYRNQKWYDALDFEYDMSVPNAAHLDAQHGGCCTVRPYFIGKLVELPLTTTQDYALFHFLSEHSPELWLQEIEMIRAYHGLISILVHPDYLESWRKKQVYIELLRFLARLRETENLWIALPGEVNRWWRTRHNLRLVRSGSGWRIEGPNAEQAMVAYASLSGDRLKYSAVSAMAQV